MDKTLYIVLATIFFFTLGYVLVIRDLIRQSRAIDKRIDYRKLRPQPPDEDEY